MKDEAIQGLPAQYRRHGRGRQYGLRWLFVLALTLSLPGLARAVPTGSPRFEALTTEQGLPQETVLAIAQDAQGFIWMNTQAGLGRYDGYRVTIYKHDPTDPASVADNFADALYVDKQGNLWIGTRNGLDRYDPATDHFLHMTVPASAGDAATQHSVYAITGDSGHGLWVGMRDGLRHFDTGGAGFDHWLRHTGDANSLSADRITALALDSRGTLWIGTPKGLNRLAANASVVERSGPDNTPQPYDDVVQSLYLDRSDRLWIGTGSGVLNLPLSGERRGLVHKMDAVEGITDTGMVGAVFQDRDGNIWIGGEKGLWRSDAQAQHFVHYRHCADDRFSLVDDTVNALFQDRTGVLWIGTWYGGASRIDLGSGGFDRYRHSVDDPQSLSNSQVIGIAADDRGQAWLATSDGLDDLDLATGVVKAVYRHDAANSASLRGNNLTAVQLDAAGRLWVGASTGLDRMDGTEGQFTHIRLKDADPKADTVIQTIVRDRDGTMWIAGSTELYHIDAADLIQFFRSDPTDPKSLANSAINALHVDRKGNVWIGTNGAGLDLRRAGSDRFEHFVNDPKDPASLSHNRVQAFLEDHKGNLWIGTAQGLNRVIPGVDGHLQFQRYTAMGGVPLDSIGGIQEDETGLLWISTTSGILRFNPDTGTFRSYSARDGLIGGSYFIGASSKGPDGRMYFGGLNGLTIFQPKDIHDNRFPPPVAITDFLVFNQSAHASPLALIGPRTLSYQDSVFSFAFAALHFADPQRNRYAYQLEGFDKNWIQTDASNRFATYTNLEPGHYRFRVKAANKDGAWNEEGLSVAITITPPFWKTWWFRTLAAILFLGSGLLTYHIRVRNLLRQRHELETLVAARTAEVQQQKDELQKAYNAVEAASLTDPLTGLHNRRFLQRHVEADAALAIRGQTPPLRPSIAAGTDQQADLLFFLVDIDHFKSINDRYGHTAGDQVLVETARRLRQLSRESDYVVRWGGEEFLLVARGSMRGHAERVAERICAAMTAKPFEIENEEGLTVSCSVGFAPFPFLLRDPRAMTWMQVLDLADHALYMAKRRGRNTWVGLQAKDATAPADVVEHLINSPQQAVFEGHLKLLTPRGEVSAPAKAAAPGLSPAAAKAPASAPPVTPVASTTASTAKAPEPDKTET